jgi:hypothetical protein
MVPEPFILKENGRMMSDNKKQATNMTAQRIKS